MNVPQLSDLLVPIGETAPSGVDLRGDTTPQSVYYRLRDARSAARAAERQADNDPNFKDAGTSHWATVRDLAVQALATDTKDLEIAAWLTESLVRMDGLPGLAAGSALLAGLVDRYWDAGLHPTPDDEGMEPRLAPVAGLSGQGTDGTLMQPLRKLVLFERSDGTTVRLWEFEQAEDVAGIGDEAMRAQRISAGVPELAQLEVEARGVGAASVGQLSQEAAAAVLAWETLDTTLSGRAAEAAPNTRRVYGLLTKLQRLAERYGIATVAMESVSHDTTPDEPQQAGPSPPPLSRPDREALLHQIIQIAAHFRSNEPNSPLGYTLDEAVRRARLAWPELLKEMLPDAGPRAAVMTGLGLRNTTE